MKLVKSDDGPEVVPIIPSDLSSEPDEVDFNRFKNIISITLDEEQKERILSPPMTFPYQKTVLAIHWHPEFVPFDLITRRIDAMFPGKEESMIIPTQHNVITGMGPYSGVEVDCYSKGFNQKVQLLLHFENERLVNKGDVLKKMLNHTFKYRGSQLFSFVDALVAPNDRFLSTAASETGASKELIRFVRAYATRLSILLKKHLDIIPEEMIKNKVVRNFFDTLRADYGDPLIERAQTFLKAVKQVVKQHFSLQYFYSTNEIIEEARSLGAGIVIPHPEQFWPILLADYDVDGLEVWNPQSQKYTDFLISVVNRKNRHLTHDKQLLIFMGDDTHMSEKLKRPSEQNPEKVKREIGFQPGWDDLKIKKQLILANVDKKTIIDEYKSRLAG